MQTLNRRQLLATTGTVALSLPCVALIMSRSAVADDLPKVSSDDPTAVALGYVADTTQVDANANPNHSVEQVCANCQLIQATEGEWRPCAIFPGKSVNANGWCKSWLKKAG